MKLSVMMSLLPISIFSAACGVQSQNTSELSSQNLGSGTKQSPYTVSAIQVESRNDGAQEYCFYQLVGITKEELGLREFDSIQDVVTLNKKSVSKDSVMQLTNTELRGALGLAGQVTQNTGVSDARLDLKRISENSNSQGMSCGATGIAFKSNLGLLDKSDDQLQFAWAWRAAAGIGAWAIMSLSPGPDDFWATRGHHAGMGIQLQPFIERRFYP